MTSQSGNEPASTLRMGSEGAGFYVMGEITTLRCRRCDSTLTIEAGRWTLAEALDSNVRIVVNPYQKVVFCQRDGCRTKWRAVNVPDSRAS